MLQIHEEEGAKEDIAYSTIDQHGSKSGTGRKLRRVLNLDLSKTSGRAL